MGQDHAEFSPLGRFLHFTLIPFLLTTGTPVFLFFLTYTLIHLDGSFPSLLEHIHSKGLFGLIQEFWLPRIFGTVLAWKVFFLFTILQLVLMRFVPGKPYQAPMHRSGHIPRYVDNGLSSYVITCVLFFVCTYGLKLFSPTLLFDIYEELFFTLNFLALVFCLFLYFKGFLFPSSTECGTTGNFIFDYYWGTELYPRIFGWDVKVYTNSRFGLMFWQMMIFSAMAKQYEVEGFIADSMWVCGMLQTMYLFKFYLWEEGYFKSTDIVVDRAGFYLCWGCLTFIFVIFNCTHCFFVTHPIHLGLPTAIIMLISGIASIWITYWIDQQKVIVREKKGKCLIFGQKPDLILAKYETTNGEEKTSILLCNGFWGISRQFHYIPELLAGLIWSLPGLTHPYPYIYIVILFMIIAHRSFRDEWKCSEKYGKYWDQYCKKVPYRVIPYLL